MLKPAHKHCFLIYLSSEHLMKMSHSECLRYSVLQILKTRNWALLSLKTRTFSPCSCGNGQLGEKKDKKRRERGRRERGREGDEREKKGSREASGLSYSPSVYLVCRVLEFLSKPSGTPARTREIPVEPQKRGVLVLGRWLS